MSYPIQLIEHGDTIVKMTKKQADELNYNLRAEIKKNKALMAEAKKAKAKYDTLWSQSNSKDTAISQLIKYKEKESKLKAQIASLSEAGCVLYKRLSSDSDIYILKLSDYYMVIEENDVVKLIPIRKKTLVNINSIGSASLPTENNLSLYLKPHIFKGEKLIF